MKGKQKLSVTFNSNKLHVNYLNGLMMNFVMMETIMLVVTGTVELAVTMTLLDGTNFALIVNALDQVMTNCA